VGAALLLLDWTLLHELEVVAGLDEVHDSTEATLLLEMWLTTGFEEEVGTGLTSADDDGEDLVHETADEVG